MFKRIVCTLLTVIFVLTSAAAAFAEGEITFPLVDEPLTLKFMAPRPSNFANGYADMKLFKEYEEKTGIHIEWIEVPSSGWTEKVNLTFASGDLPDAFIREQIRNSYLLVLRQSVTPRARREEILRYIEEHGLPE